MGDLTLEESEPYYEVNGNSNSFQWEEVNGELFAMEKIIKSIPREIVVMEGVVDQKRCQ